MFGLSRIEWLLIAGFALAIATGGAIAAIYHKGESAGSSKVEATVEHRAVDELDQARKQKEQADEKARTQPDAAVIDRTR